MAGALLAEGLKSAWSSGGTTGAERTPTVSPGLDPGKYAFELWFNKKRREEEERARQEELAIQQRQFDATLGQRERQSLRENAATQRQLGLAGIDRLAETRSAATKNARTMAFARDLAEVSRMG